jgi:hypothetical protein
MIYKFFSDHATWKVDESGKGTSEAMFEQKRGGADTPKSQMKSRRISMLCVTCTPLSRQGVIM